MAKRKKVTLKTIAQKVGCSISVVSTVLNKSKGNTWVSPDMREKVQRTAEKLGYTASYHARSLRTGKANAIGLMLSYPGKATSWISAVSEGVQRGAYERDHDLIAIGPRDNEGELERGLQYAREGRIDAVVCLGRKFRLSQFDVSQFEIPFVLANEDLHNTGLPTVGVDEKPGIITAAKHLKDLGHTEILWLSIFNEDGTELAPKRRNTVRDQASKLGLKLHERRIPGQEPRDTNSPVFKIGEEFLSFPPVTAVICYNERLGFELYDICKKKGIRIPEDLSVISFDDIDAEIAIPPMTVVSLMLHEIGRQAALQAIDMIHDSALMKTMQGKRTEVPAELVVRASTAEKPIKPAFPLSNQ